jgi:hypothetical protein
VPSELPHIGLLENITADGAVHHLPAIVAINGEVPAGVLLLKRFISRAHIDSRAAASFIRTSLTKLDKKMIELGSNVVKFSIHVKAQVSTLARRGQTSDDLLINLFKGCKKTNDVKFQELICRKKNHCKEGRDVNVNNLMIDTDMKHRGWKLCNKWSAPAKEQEQILALTAHIEQLKSHKLSKLVPCEPAPTGNIPKKTKKDNKWAWKDILPKDGKPRTKLFKETQHHCDCPHHKNHWVCHAVEECMRNPANAPPAGVCPALADRAATPGARRHQRAQLAAALLKEKEESSEEEEEDDL